MPRLAPCLRGLGALALALCLSSGMALAEGPPRLEIHGLAAFDGIVATTPNFSGVADGELAARLRLDVRHAASDLVDFKLDAWGRLGITSLQSDTGTPSTFELRELSVSLRRLAGRVDLTLGRFPVPGGFWLIADGARVDVRYADWITQSAYGGLRAFTTQRNNADLDFNQPVALPLAGTTLLFHHRIIDASVGFTWARDVLDLPTTLGPNDDRPQRDIVDEFFLDGQLMILAHPTLLLAGGASAGSRYDVQFQTPDPTAPVQIGVATLGAVSAWGMAAWRPVPRIHITYTINYERLRLIESQLPLKNAKGLPLAFTGGSFLDDAVRVNMILWRALKLEVRYRLRWRENTDIEHHATVGLRGDNLWRGFGLFASIGLDLVEPGITKLTTRIIYSGGLSYQREHLDISAGILFTDGVGSGLLFSQAAPGSPNGIVPNQLFPYLLESNRVAFLRVFGNYRGFFGGLDVEENTDSAQLRAMAQIGYSR